MGGEQSQLRDSDEQVRRNVSFLINGKEYNVNTDFEKIGTESLLIDYIRDHVGLKGTKYMCREGGCGACVVTVKTRNPSTGEESIRSVNSCLMPVFACDGWDISTIEHLGTTKSGRPLHPIQERMVKFSGTQCGYCTPGWIMNMYGLMQSKKSSKLMSQDIEDSMDGNICRCTGYRPILDAMKSMAVDASEQLKRKCGDIGTNCVDCPCSDLKNNLEIDSGEFDKCESMAIHLNLPSGNQWVKAIDINSLFIAIQKFLALGLRYRIVAGNTGTGVYKEDGPFQAYVELNSIYILTKITIAPTLLILGGAVTISEAIVAMQKAGELSGYEYCKQIASHWKRVASTPVRNAATLAGNLMLKHAHRDFPSDIFLVLETIGALLTIASAPSLQKMYTVQEFLTSNMTGKVIFSIHFPQLRAHSFRSFKITRRFQNAHAYVNAGFLALMDPKMATFSKLCIVFGGISPNFVHATNTEMFLLGKPLDEKTIQGAMTILDSELKPDIRPPDASPIYRKSLAQALLYKFLLGMIGNKIKNEKIKSGGMDLARGLSYGKQTYDTSDKSEWPLYQPVPKLEGPIQVTGEAEYTNDIHSQVGELHGALVVTKIANATLSQVNTRDALKLPGVVTFVNAQDIPGPNNFMSFTTTDKPDVIFVKDKILHAGQPVGVILAETREIALMAAKLVKLSYTNVEKPILDIKSSLEKAKMEMKLQDCLIKVVKSQESVTDAPHSITGEFQIGSQYHYTMEPQTCICIPKEDGMDVHVASQWINHVQNAISDCLVIPANSVNVHVRRLGGGFGCKLARASLSATICAVAANKVQRPVRLVLDMESMMGALGKRLPYLFKYTVTFDDSGKIMSLNVDIITDNGCTLNEPTAFIALLCMQSCYSAVNWQVKTHHVTTNLASNTYCRAPGSPQGIACSEYIMEHIAFYLKKDAMDVRIVNLLQKGESIFTVPGKVSDEDNRIPGFLQDLTLSADLDERKKFVQNFNVSNRWKKRGLSFASMRCPIHYWFTGYNIFMSIYAKDGSVALSHSGIEIGQGINTKVAQVVARQLKIPLEKVKVKPVTSLVAANSTATGGAVTSEHICYAAVKACELLLARLAPVRDKLENPSWEVLVAESHKLGIDLTSYYNTSYSDQLKDYSVWGLSVCEVEIDVLTGEYKIIRMDVMNDAGISMSPEVDVGQVEGSVIFGLGMWLTEKIQYDQNTGELLTNRTWEYKPPACKDVPEDFRVTLLPNSPNPYGVLRSKATGEAPLCMSVAAFFAIKQAITSARMDAGNMEWFQLNGPVTPEDIQRLCLTTTNQFSI